MSASRTALLICLKGVGFALVYVLAIVVLALDQWTKWLVRTHIALGHSIPVFPPALYITYTQNSGAAWSILPNQQWLFIIIALVVIGVVIIVERKMRTAHRWLKIPLGLLVGGALGNLVDRVHMHTVTDFIEVRIIHYPIFNVADSAIVVAVILLVLDSFRTKNRSSITAEGDH